MKNIAVGKIGSKVIFDRSSADANRPNSNGNVGAYNTFRLLFEKNPDVNFYFIGDSDLPLWKNDRWTNVYNLGIPTHQNYYSFMREFLDFGIFLAGIDEQKYLPSYSSSSPIGEFIEHCLGDRYILLSDDPRCLYSSSKTLKTLPPRCILGQNNRSLIWDAGRCGHARVHESYFPLEFVDAYDATLVEPIDRRRSGSSNVMSIVANTTFGMAYDRIEVIANILAEANKHNCLNIKFYGKLHDEAETKKIIDTGCNFVGKVDYDEIQSSLKSTLSTFLVPVFPGVATTKYVEALINGCLPVFWHEYGVSHITGFADVPVIHNADGLRNIYMYLLRDWVDAAGWTKVLQDNIVKPYTTGEKLNNMIMDKVRSYN